MSFRTPLGTFTDRTPLSREAIHNLNRGDSYVSPHYGDGGWHDTPGITRDITQWQPMNDRIFVRLLPLKPQSNSIASPQSAAGYIETREGIVLKCGPGKWISGTWWSVKQKNGTRKWEWIPGYRQQMLVNPGDHVAIGRWTDWETWEAGYEADSPNIVICQDMDVRYVRRNGINIERSQATCQ